MPLTGWWLLASLTVLSVGALQPLRVPLSVSRAVVSIDGVRSASSQMSADGVRTEWKFVKGINDYGKEQTYMYLGKAEGKAKFADPVANSLIDESAAEGLIGLLWEKAYLLALFAPALLCTLYAFTN
uniref:Uncharacterized protein n=1 Tax=Calcidiscus leptoporus TaxID=127549 RepID=A0A7S0J254_9EUKA|mmetsp:Transcript_34678/g.81262  ORF Transcript_34678/g.81262 Transcript_34678/m.81262 type:complete len:127 (+) Transcript_34678:54-434(+)|eukprot:CAMPEP_0119374338 /NCGR_PEP_ID=MMETSP1334-20130426/30535_1 /TAXON_ID=127549 /ORGANISM="Calcidiscus leptoporus, Strain RCC1130" /LENGTH=126 /DNA_ID=CAMNT_0007392381 /DNA_START=50 /DNA_END=430 /DNA_ORIENTATION=+